LGPTLAISKEIHEMKYRNKGESFERAMTRIADHLKDGTEHFESFRDILLDMRFLPAGRVQSAVGSPREVTAYNCFVSGTIEDSMTSIMNKAHEAAETMRRGGGIGYDFSRLRPRGDLIGSLDSRASGPVSFMQIYDAICQTIASAGHRRGAQMGVLRVDHPDIEEFIRAKQNGSRLTGFNVSVGVTDLFMEHLRAGIKFPLVYEGRIYKYVNPQSLWDEIMRSTWDWAEPGVLFIDTINRMNNLYYCEEISATNPCGEQPLPPYGACLLGSFNISRYIRNGSSLGLPTNRVFDEEQFYQDIPHVVRAIDNVIDRTTYPLVEQELEAKNKRRMGLGVTGIANAAEALGNRYGSDDYLEFQDYVLKILRDRTYEASADLAAEKGSFPLYDQEKYLDGSFTKTLPDWLRDKIQNSGIRNSHLTSIAPTGTISLTADNVSSGIEPPFNLEYERTIQTFDGPRIEKVRDYGYHKFGVRGATADTISAQDHVRVLGRAQTFIDSAVSKTCNVGDSVNFEDFKSLYTEAYGLGCKGITTFRAAGKRYGILNAVSEPKSGEIADTSGWESAEACYIDPETGQKECS
jgi:ribonucleoside-diphosphate reductase alpha chain